MKKNGLLTLLALTSCVAGLTGCNNDPSIKVSGLSNEVAVGSTIDLDSFVKVSGTSKSYKVYIYEDSRDLVELNGHKLTFLDEGEVTFLVYIGKLEVKVELNSYYKMRYDLIQNFKGYTNKYTIIGDKDTYLHRDGYAERIFYHQSSESYSRKGYLLQNGSELAYRYDASLADDFVFDKIVTKEEFNSDYNGAFGVDFAKAKKSKGLQIDGKAVECYALKEAQIIKFATNNLVADSYSKFYATLPVDEKGVYKADSTTYGDIQVSLGAVYFTIYKNEPMAVVFAAIDQKAVYLDTLKFSNKNKDLSEDEGVKAKLDEEIEVGLPDTELIQDYFANGLAQSKNFIAEFDCDWVNAQGAHTAFPAQYRSYWIAKLPVCHSTRVLNEDSIVNIVNNEIVSGVVNHGENTVYEFFKKNGEMTKRVNEDYQDVFEDEYDSTSFIGRVETWPSDAIYLDTLSGSVATYGFNLDRYSNILDAVLFCDDNAAKVITTFLNNDQPDYFDWFEERSLVVNYSTGLIELSFQFPLMTDGSLNYRVKFTIQPDSEDLYDSQIAEFISELFA